MLENPFLTPPQVESPQSRSWGRGLVFGFQGPPASVATPVDVEDPDAFQQGVAAGQQALTSGLDFVEDPCFDLHAEGPELSVEGFEAVHVAVDLIAKAFTHAVASGVVLLFNLSISLQTKFDDPIQALQNAATQLQSLLTDMGIGDSMQLFVGGGVDFNAQQCEIKVTGVFRSLEAARTAAQAFGRNQFVVVSWRTDQSGGMKFEDGNV